MTPFWNICQKTTRNLEWNGDRFRKWAERIGNNTYKVVDAILTSKRVEQQTYKGCIGLLKLADKYSVERLEAACEKALSYTTTPSYRSIKNILTAGRINLLILILILNQQTHKTSMASQEVPTIIGGKHL